MGTEFALCRAKFPFVMNLVTPLEAFLAISFVRSQKQARLRHITNDLVKVRVTAENLEAIIGRQTTRRRILGKAKIVGKPNRPFIW